MEEYVLNMPILQMRRSWQRRGGISWELAEPALDLGNPAQGPMFLITMLYCLWSYLYHKTYKCL